MPRIGILESQSLVCKISDDFYLCLKNTSNENPSFVQKMRLLWEVYTQIRHKLHDRKTSYEEMLLGTVCLCLIFFPTVKIDYISEETHAEHQERETKIDFKNRYEVHPVLGPQKF